MLIDVLADGLGIDTTATPDGILDMAGNVHQWTSSLALPYPYRADDGREDPTRTGDRVTRDGTLIVGGLEPGGRWDYRLDGGAWQAGSGDRVASTAAGGEGAHRVEIRHTDLAGNVAITAAVLAMGLLFIELPH